MTVCNRLLWVKNVSAKTFGKTKRINQIFNRTVFLEHNGYITHKLIGVYKTFWIDFFSLNSLNYYVLTNNRTLTLKCGGRAVNEHSNEQNGQKFKAKFRKKKYCQCMLNRKYQTENATSDKDKSTKLTNL